MAIVIITKMFTDILLPVKIPDTIFLYASLAAALGFLYVEVVNNKFQMVFWYSSKKECQEYMHLLLKKLHLPDSALEYTRETTQFLSFTKDIYVIRNEEGQSLVKVSHDSTFTHITKNTVLHVHISKNIASSTEKYHSLRQICYSTYREVRKKKPLLTFGILFAALLILFLLPLILIHYFDYSPSDPLLFVYTVGFSISFLYYTN
ncbi:MAG: hypothetical protein PHX86_07200 [Caldisericia bacterium]|nr:hypothetical protein [Caldisericia bacterium]